MSVAPKIDDSMQFVLRRHGAAVSTCGRYWITYATLRDGRVEREWCNAWYGEPEKPGTKHLHGTFNREEAKRACVDHARRGAQAGLPRSLPLF